MSNIVITGGCGYIGSHTIIPLLEEGYTIHIIDNLSNSSSIVLDRIRDIVGIKLYGDEVLPSAVFSGWIALNKINVKYLGRVITDHNKLNSLDFFKQMTTWAISIVVTYLFIKYAFLDLLGIDKKSLEKKK